MALEIFLLNKILFYQVFWVLPYHVQIQFKADFDILGTNLVHIRAFYVLRSALKHKTKIIFFVDVVQLLVAGWS